MEFFLAVGSYLQSLQSIQIWTQNQCHALLYRGICKPWVNYLSLLSLIYYLITFLNLYIYLSTRFFFKGQSVNTNLDVVYTDVSEAFDRVNHACLIKKTCPFIRLFWTGFIPMYLDVDSICILMALNPTT